MKKSILCVSVAAILTFATGSCSDNDVDTTPSIAPAVSQEIIENIVKNVIAVTYTDLNTKAIALADAAINFEKTATEEKLTTLKEAWIAARSPWEKSEGFLYGIVDTEGLDPRIDSWPIKDGEIHGRLHDESVAITSSILTDDITGFHGLEYLIWGSESNKKAANFTNRELQYVVVVAKDIKETAAKLHNEWSNPTQERYAYKFIHSEQTGFMTKKDVLDQIVRGMAKISDEVGTGKIKDPLVGIDNKPADPMKDESRLSRNSKIDFMDNIRSIQNVYFGNYQGTEIKGAESRGINRIVTEKAPELDEDIKTKITDAIAAIDAIPVTFTDALTHNRDAVKNAMDKVMALDEVLEKKLKPLISGLKF